MCIVLIAKSVHPHYPLIILANRDEFFQRPTQQMHWWGTDPDILAGRDELKGGAWFGINERKQIALVTNYREPQASKKSSRGELVSDFLLNQHHDMRVWLIANGERYAGFNLIYGDLEHLTHYCNRSKLFTEIGPGIHGLSNATLNTPWPKVEQGKSLLQAAVSRPEIETGELFSILQNTHRPPDGELPRTGVGVDLERALSSIFIEPTGGYGSRSATVLLAGSSQVRVWEKDYLRESELDFMLL